jgi:hypothetical protein
MSFGVAGMSSPRRNAAAASRIPDAANRTVDALIQVKDRGAFS